MRAPATVLAALSLAAAASSPAFASAAGGSAVPAVGEAPSPRAGTALIITGAAARIPQEAALLQALDERGLLTDLAFISGDSSGALNAVALNAIRSGRMTWARYRQILAGLGDKDIFLQSGSKLPVDTAPLRRLLEKVVEGEMGFETIGQLPIPTSISITRLSDLGLRRTVYRMCSERINEESDPSLSLVDLLMASTAFPVVFPSERIRSATTIPDIDYVDGGAGEDYIPYEAALQFERARGRDFERVFIVSRKSDSAPEISEELRGLGVNDHGIFDKLGLSMDALASRRLSLRLAEYAKRAPDLASRSYVWRPDFPGKFPLFSFSDLEAQYAATEAWASSHEPEPLAAYLARRKRSAPAPSP